MRVTSRDEAGEGGGSRSERLLMLNMMRASPVTTRNPSGRGRFAWFTRCALAAILALAIASCTRNAPPDVGVPPADPNLPEPVPLSWLSTVALDRFLAGSAWFGLQSGYVAMFARDGRVVHATTAGYADIDAARPMELDTRFRLASMTKPVTAVAAMQLVERGRLGLDDPVSKYIPVASDLRVATSHDASADGTIPTEPLETPLTVRHLLEFRAGIGAEGDRWSDLGRLWATRDIYRAEGSLGDRVNDILTVPLYEQPGRQWRYGWTADVLARVVEVAAGRPFGDVVRTGILEPLGMSRTGFLGDPVAAGAPEASMYTQDEDGNLLLVERPASDAPDWTPGGSGLISTAPDYMRFALMLWNGGTYDGVQILKPETVALMRQPHVPEGVLESEDIQGLGWGLGMAVVVDADTTPTPDSVGDFWWSGYYGTTFLVSPETGLVAVVLAQNQPSEFSAVPFPVFLAQGFALFGL